MEAAAVAAAKHVRDYTRRMELRAKMSSGSQWANTATSSSKLS